MRAKSPKDSISSKSITPPTNSKDNITTRITIIVKQLYEGLTLQVDELASEFGTSLRTVQRDLSHIASLLPLKHHNGMYSLDISKIGRAHV